MAKYVDTKTLKKLGERLRNERLNKRWLIKDLVDKTGFAYETIENIESGGETSLSYFIEICKSLEIAPKDIFDFPIVLKPRFEHTPDLRKRISYGVEELIKGGYFNTHRTSFEVVVKLKASYGIETDTSTISTILRRRVNSEVLESNKLEGEKRSFQYIIRRKT